MVRDVLVVTFLAREVPLGVTFIFLSKSHVSTPHTHTHEEDKRTSPGCNIILITLFTMGSNAKYTGSFHILCDYGIIIKHDEILRTLEASFR